MKSQGGRSPNRRPAEPLTEEEIFDLFDLTPEERVYARDMIKLRALADEECRAFVAQLDAHAKHIADQLSAQLGAQVEWDGSPA